MISLLRTRAAAFDEFHAHRADAGRGAGTGARDLAAGAALH
jgi:hypothetical protein